MGLKIANFTQEYPQGVLKVQQNSNETPNEEEIGALMTDIVRSEEELSMGLSVEKTDKPKKSGESEYSDDKEKKKKKLKREYAIEVKKLEIYKKDYENGTAKGNEFSVLNGAGVGFGIGSILGEFLILGGIGDLAGGKVLSKITKIKNTPILKKLHLNKVMEFVPVSKGCSLFGVGALVAGAMALGAGITGLVNTVRSNGHTGTYKEYTANLPEMIRQQEQKVKELEQKIAEL